MKAKNSERTLAINLRKRGRTIPEIAQALQVSKSSVSVWLREISLPRETMRELENRRVKSRLLANAAKRKITRLKLGSAHKEAQEILKTYNLDKNSALILCALMYWCEGAKSKNDAEFTFTNAEPLLVRGFLSLLRMSFSLDESKFRVKMHLHEYHDESTQKKLWSDVTGISKVQFQNTYWKTNSGFNVKPGYPGCVHIRYHDVIVSRKISAVARNFLSSINMLE